MAFYYLRELGLNRLPKGKLGEFLADVKATLSLCTEELVVPAQFRRVAEERGAELLGLKKQNPEAVEKYAAVADAYGRYVELLKDVVASGSRRENAPTDRRYSIKLQALDDENLRELQRILRDLEHEKQMAVQQAWVQPWRR